MKFFRILLVFLSTLSFSVFAQNPVKSSALSMQFDTVSVKQLVLVLYDSCLSKRGIVFDPSASALDGMASVRLVDASCSTVERLVSQVVSSAGLVFQKESGYDILRKPLGDDQSSWSLMVYQPRNRDSFRLAELAQVAIRKGRWAHARSSMPSAAAGPVSSEVPETGSNIASQMSKVQDRLVYFGPPVEAENVRRVLAMLDTPESQVEVRVGVYEFTSGGVEGGGVAAALDLFKGRVSASLTSSTVAGAGAAVARVAAGGIEAALSLLDRDSRFRYVARPKLLVKDSEPARFFAGEEVRVAGAVTLDAKGNPFQSRETLSAGVTLEVTPKVYADSVELGLYQAVSSFTAASSGSEPSTLKRDLRSTILARPGEVYVVGGLTSSKRTQGEARLLGFRTSVTDDQSESEIVLVVSVTPTTGHPPSGS